MKKRNRKQKERDYQTDGKNYQKERDYKTVGN